MMPMIKLNIVNSLSIYIIYVYDIWYNSDISFCYEIITKKCYSVITKMIQTS